MNGKSLCEQKFCCCPPSRNKPFSLFVLLTTCTARAIHFTIGSEGCQVTTIGAWNHKITHGNRHSPTQSIVVNLEKLQLFELANFRGHSSRNVVTGKPNLARITEKTHFRWNAAREWTVRCRKCDWKRVTLVSMQWYDESFRYYHQVLLTQRITQLSNFCWNGSIDSCILINPKFLNFVKVLDKTEIALQIAIVKVEIL